ncbi:MAG: hypothetical protein ABI183_11615 [Polyangiaceae bacterium]
MRLRGNLLLVAGVCGAFGIFFACGSSSGGSDFTNGTDASNTDAISVAETGPGLGGDGATTCNPCSDFPATPIIDGASDAGTSAVAAAPANSETLFGAAGSGAATGGPCVFEPEVGTLFPNNWLRPSFAYVPVATQNLFEIRLHTAKETNDLVVYTRSNRWTMPKAMWTSLAANVQGDPITMTVRAGVYDDGAGTLSGISVGSSGDISIAPAPAQGSIIYWVTTTASLKGFAIGDEGVVDIVKPAQVGEPVGCVGCHGSAGDGKFVLSSTVPGSDGSHAWLSMTTTDGDAAAPPTSIVSASANTLLLRQTQEAPTTSGAHFQTGDRLVVSNYNDGTSNQIIWTDLEATNTNQWSGTGTTAGFGWGIFARTGDFEITSPTTPRQGGQAAFSHDGTKIAFVSADTMAYGVAVISRDADIKTIPFNNRAGGAVTPVNGASDPAYSEFYPTFSPQGDKLLAFDRVPATISNPAGDGNGDNYANPLSQVYVVPSGGAATATRLAANDPPACLSGQASPGVSNSWPKWAPNATDVGGKTYYWLVFSTIRGATPPPVANPTPQLYLSSVVVDDATGAIDASHAALRIWNQPAAEHNHTPAWDFFAVPPSGPR